MRTVSIHASNEPRLLCVCGPRQACPMPPHCFPPPEWLDARCVHATTTYYAHAQCTACWHRIAVGQLNSPLTLMFPTPPLQPRTRTHGTKAEILLPPTFQAHCALWAVEGTSCFSWVYRPTTPKSSAIYYSSRVIYFTLSQANSSWTPVDLSSP